MDARLKELALLQDGWLDGGLSLEWDGPHGGLDLVVDLGSQCATASLGDEQRQLNLTTSAGWAALNDLLDGAPMQA